MESVDGSKRVCYLNSLLSQCFWDSVDPMRGPKNSLVNSEVVKYVSLSLRYGIAYL
jgi:hypothetical protein